MLEAADPDQILSKRKAISAFIPYAIYLTKHGEHEMINMISRVASASNSGEFMWHHVRPYIIALFDKPTRHSLSLVFALASFPYTEVIGQDVVYALLQIASVDSLRRHIPVTIWAWLKKQPDFPCELLGRSEWTKGDVVHHVRSLGDIEILKSYLIFVWSVSVGVDDRLGGLDEIQVSIREDFNGIGMVHHREDLIRQLGKFLRPVLHHTSADQEAKTQYSESRESSMVVPPRPMYWIYPRHQRAIEQYSKLKAVLLEVDEEAMNILTRMPPKLILFFSMLTHRYSQDPI